MENIFFNNRLLKYNKNQRSTIDNSMNQINWRHRLHPLTWLLISCLRVTFSFPFCAKSGQYLHTGAS